MAHRALGDVCVYFMIVSALAGISIRRVFDYWSKHPTGEHSIDFYPQCFNNPETVMSTVESEHDKTNTMTCAASKFYYQSGHPQSLISLRRPSKESLDPWLPIKCTAKTDQTGRMLRLILFLSGSTDHLVDFCHAPAYFLFPLTIINTFSFH